MLVALVSSFRVFNPFLVLAQQATQDICDEVTSLHGERSKIIHEHTTLQDEEQPPLITQENRGPGVKATEKTLKELGDATAAGTAAKKAGEEEATTHPEGGELSDRKIKNALTKEQKQKQKHRRWHIERLEKAKRQRLSTPVISDHN
jgi:hypothetical protein